RQFVGGVGRPTGEINAQDQKNERTVDSSLPALRASCSLSFVSFNCASSFLCWKKNKELNRSGSARHTDSRIFSTSDFSLRTASELTESFFIRSFSCWSADTWLASATHLVCE